MDLLGASTSRIIFICFLRCALRSSVDDHNTYLRGAAHRVKFYLEAEMAYALFRLMKVFDIVVPD